LKQTKLFCRERVNNNYEKRIERRKKGNKHEATAFFNHLI
jgi:hypothetical protein